MSGEPEPPVFDDDFIRGASFTEPSARERARRPGWLKRRRIARAARRRMRRGGSRMKTAGTVLAVVVAMALVGALAWKIRGGRTLSPETAPIRTGPVPAIGAANPFEGSPAASYADGAAGIVPPPAKPVGRFSARNMVAAYANTEHLLAASALDRPTLYDDSAPEKVASSGRPLDPYDQSNPEPKDGKCFRSTGT